MIIGAAVVKDRSRVGKDDTKFKSITVFQFVDNDQLTNLIALLVRYRPEVCYHIKAPKTKSPEVHNKASKVLTDLLEDLNIVENPLDARFFNDEDIEVDLKRVLGETSLLKYAAEVLF